MFGPPKKTMVVDRKKQKALALRYVASGQEFKTDG